MFLRDTDAHLTLYAGTPPGRPLPPAPKCEDRDSVRTVPECIAVGKKDVPARSSMLDHRFVAGDSALYRDFARSLEKKLFPREEVSRSWVDPGHKTGTSGNAASNSSDAMTKTTAG